MWSNYRAVLGWLEDSKRGTVHEIATDLQLSEASVRRALNELRSVDLAEKESTHPPVWVYKKA